ncbi:MAG TPA: hypothetical protein VN829_16075, partial [Dongiaceae bacterium]|nr:hypothetical protein [Dongiaceae bacterium]
QELIEECANLAILLEVVFLPKTGYPHQQLSFVLGKGILGKASRRGYDCNSALVVREYSGTTLSELAEFVADQFSNPDLDFPGSPFARERLRWLEALEKRLSLTLAQAMARDGASLKLFESIKARAAGSTHLEDYWPGGAMAPEDAVTGWCHKVGAKLRGMLGPAQLKGKDALCDEIEQQARQGCQ